MPTQTPELNGPQPEIAAAHDVGPRTSGMVFRPLPCPTRWEGVAVTTWLLLVDMLLLIWMWRRPVDSIKFVLVLSAVSSVPLILHLAYRTWTAFSLEYWVDRNAVTVHWASSRQVIPLPHIQRVITGGIDSLSNSGWMYWPAPFVGNTGRALGLLNISMLSTRPLSECLLLDTGSAVFAVSPADYEGFLAAVQTRYRLGPVANLQPAKVRSSLYDRVFQADVVGPALLGAGLAGVLLLFGTLMLQFPDLPDAMAFHYNTDSIPDIVREKSTLFLLPFIGLLAWMTNGLWGIWMALHNQRTGAYMLWGGTIVVQVCSLLALNGIMN